MKVLVYGGRDFTNELLANQALDELHAVYGFSVVIDGVARGADTLAYQWAKSRGILSQRFPAEWGRYGKAAGPIRNQQMIDEGKPEMGIAFPGGNGTTDMTRRLLKQGIHVIPITGN